MNTQTNSANSADKINMSSPAAEKEASKKEASGAITYAGVVTTTILRGTKILSKTISHNKGSEYLFKCLALALMQEFDPLDMPAYIKLYADTSDTSEVTGPLYAVDRQLVEKSVEVTGQATADTVPSATFLFSIPFTSISSGANGNRSYKRIQLFSSRGVQLAEFEYPDTQTLSADDGGSEYTLLIEWAMSFGNNS